MTLKKVNGNEGKPCSDERRQRLREGAQRRALTGYPHISVKGVVYPSVSAAHRATGYRHSQLRKWALSDEEQYRDIFFVDTSKESK